MHSAAATKAASRSRRCGDPTRIQAELGHSDPALTLRVYGHLWPDEIEIGREALDALLDERVGRHMDHAAAGASANPHG